MPSLDLTQFRNFQLSRRWLVLAALWLLLCLLWTAPAALFATLAQAALPQLQLEAVTGSFWRGRAGQAYWSWQNQRVALGSVEWKLKPWTLLWLRPGAHIAATYGQQFIDTDASVGFGGLRLTDTRATLPVPALSFWLPAPADGLLALNLQQARFDGERLRALQGEVNLQQARWQWSGRWLALGDYRVLLQLEDERLTGDFSGGSDLAANGQIAANLAQRSYELKSTLKFAETLPSEFRDGAELLLAAKPDGEGRWRVERSGKW